MCDQWRPDCLGVLGHPLVKTPNLDKLARGGALFENAYCASPVCSPARASWLTGLYPHAHGQYVNYGEKAAFTCEMRRECVTLGDSLKAAGYRCGIVGPWHLGHDHEPQHGFEESWLTYRYQGKGRPDRLADYFGKAGVPNLYNRKARPPGSFPWPPINKVDYTVYSDPRQQRTTWTVDRGCEFIAGAGSDARPFFLFLSVKDPHAPIVVPPELLALYPAERMPLPEAWRDGDSRPDYQRSARERLPADVRDADFQRMVAHYFAAMTHVDREIGRVLAMLERQGIRDDTIVAFISDHGEMLGQHGFLAKRLFYEASVRVPCIVSWPARIPASRVKTPLAGVDLAPTLLELAGVERPKQVDGRSVAVALTKGREPEPQPVFAELATQEVHCGMTADLSGLGGHIMVRDGRWKLVWSRFDIDELYDLEGDPEENFNVAADPRRAGEVRRLKDLTRQMLGRTGPGVFAWCLETAETIPPR